MIINPPSINIPEGFSFRKATNNDIHVVQKIVFQTLEEYGLTPEPEAVDRDLSDIEKNYSDGFFGVIVYDQEVVATFALSPLSDSITEIRKMYALPKIRGKGLGKWMVNYLLDISRANYYHEVELETASSLVEAIGLYKMIGFIEKDFENKTPRCDKAFFMKL